MMDICLGLPVDAGTPHSIEKYGDGGGRGPHLRFRHSDNVIQALRYVPKINCNQTAKSQRMMSM